MAVASDEAESPLPTTLGSTDDPNVVENAALPESYPLEADEAVQAPRPFDIPKQSYYLHHWTGRVTCVARRETSSSTRARSHHKSPNDRVVFYVQGVPGIYRTRALFVAQREERGSRYDIFNVYNNNTEKNRDFMTGLNVDPRYAGQLTIEKKSYQGHINCTLFRRDSGSPAEGAAAETEVSATIYNRKSLRFPVVNGSPDRIAYSVIARQDEENIRSNNSNNSDDNPAKPTRSRIEEAVQPHLSYDIHALQGEADHKDQFHVFQTKRRFTNRRGANVHDDASTFFQRFGRRAQLASKKNFQMMDINSGRVLLQVGRWDSVEFTVDFLPPYTPFDAFGVCLAQLECNR